MKTIRIFGNTTLSNYQGKSKIKMNHFGLRRTILRAKIYKGDQGMGV